MHVSPRSALTGKHDQGVVDRTASQMDLNALREEFSRDGCVVIRNFLDREELAELDARTEAYLERGKHREWFAKKKAFAGTLKNLNVHDKWFDQLLREGRPARVVAHLLDDELHPATAAFFDRLPGETTGIAPHFDALGHRRQGATLWIALDVTRKENGCLYYVKGSHNKEFESKIGLAGFNESTEGAFAVELNPGDAAVHSALTVHWSYANQTERSRRGLSFFYSAASSKGGKFNKSGLIHRAN